MKKFTFITALLMLVSFSACTPEPTYEDSSVVFFLSEASAQTAVSNGLTSLDFYIDGVKEGVIATDYFANTVPSCSTEEFSVFTARINKTTNYKFEFRNGNTVTQQGDLTLTKGACFPVEVIF